MLGEASLSYYTHTCSYYSFGFPEIVHDNTLPHAVSDL